MSDEPRAITPDELRDKLLDHLHDVAMYWATVKTDELPPVTDKTVLRRIEGAIFSTLAALDGSTMGIPGFDLVAKPHPDDKQYCIDNGENWIEDETRISDTLHEHWYKQEQRK